MLTEGKKKNKQPNKQTKNNRKTKTNISLHSDGHYFIPWQTRKNV